jgi:hypothetical protein
MTACRPWLTPPFQNFKQSERHMREWSDFPGKPEQCDMQSPDAGIMTMENADLYTKDMRSSHLFGRCIPTQKFNVIQFDVLDYLQQNMQVWRPRLAAWTFSRSQRLYPENQSRMSSEVHGSHSSFILLNLGGQIHLPLKKLQYSYWYFDSVCVLNISDSNIDRKSSCIF